MFSWCSGGGRTPRGTNPLAMTAPLPVITTRRPDRRDRGYLAWVAVANEIAHLWLESAPIDASTHVLEIHVDGFNDPLVVLAEPLGAPTDKGFPLKLRPLDEHHEAVLRHELFGGPAPEPPKKPSLPPPTVTQVTPAAGVESPRRAPSSVPPPLSEGHAMALGRMTNPSSLSRRAPGALVGRTLGDGRFTLESLIGAGASGEVYRAVHTALRRFVAVKVLHPSLQLSPDYCTRFYSEALAASRLDHKNVLRIIDYGQEPEGLLYIVMELLEGESLQDVLDQQGALPVERIVDLVSQACAGLGHAHDAGVIHRDIKPENIIVVRRRDDDGRERELVKVCDFGIAHWTQVGPQLIDDDADTVIMRPDASKIVGTPVYMAPEQIRNEAVDARTDVYALGVVLYELATGRVPFAAANPMDIMTQHLLDPPTPPSKVMKSVEKDLEEVILAALQKDPEKRPKDTRALRALLKDLVDDDWGTTSNIGRRVSIKTVLSAQDFLTNTAESLGVMHSTDDRTRGVAYAALGEAIRAAVLQDNVKLARDLVAWLESRLADQGAPVDEREHAERTVRTLRDPEVVRRLAGNYLDAKLGRDDDGLSLLTAAGPVAAHALVEARRQRPAALEMRSRFVAGLRAVGPAGIPPIVASLEPLAGLASRNDEALAEDLLRAIPETRSDLAGDTTVRFVRLDKPSIGIAALRVTAALWGIRARPLLVGVLDATNADPFRLVAIEALQKMTCIDDVVVERLGRILVSNQQGAEEVKLAAAGALAFASPEARPRAVGFLHQRLAPQQGFMSSLLSALGPREDTRVLVALARSLTTLDPAGARGTLERLANAKPELRPHVDAIFAGR